MTGTLSALGRELGLLLSQTGRTWWRLAAGLSAVMLVGWLGYYSSVLLGAWAVSANVWLAVPCLALGVVIQLTAMIIAMRLAGMGTATPDDGATTMKILGATLLPFLCIYSAFGFVNSSAQDLIIVTATRSSSLQAAAVIGELNPLTSMTLTLIVLGSIVALYLTRTAIDALAKKLKKPWLGLASAFVEANFGILILLAGFRFFRLIYLWWVGRQGAHWWHQVMIWLKDLTPAGLRQVGASLSEAIWPVLWQLITQPLAWLALAGLVAGLRLTSSSDLLEALQQKLSHSDSPSLRRQRVRQHFNLHFSEIVLSDVNNKVLPTWFSFRFIWRAGPVFLGAFMIAFSAIGLLDNAVWRLMMLLFGNTEITVWMNIMPLIGLVSKVVIFSLRAVLLGLAFSRLEQIISGAAQPSLPDGPKAEATDEPSRPTPRWLAVLAVSMAVIITAVSSFVLQSGESTVTQHRQPGSPTRLLDTVVLVEDLRFGAAITTTNDKTTTTDFCFVVVQVSLTPEHQGSMLRPTMVAGRHSYRAWDGVDSDMSSEPGFRTIRDVIFEVDPTDLTGKTVQVTFQVIQAVTAVEQRLSVTFPLTSATISACHEQVIDVLEHPFVEVPR